jgi:hypothetical protein
MADVNGSISANGVCRVTSTGGTCVVLPAGASPNWTGTGFAFQSEGNTSPIGFLQGANERLRLTSDSYLRLAAGTGGIQFGGDTAAANALDDYEEGTFVPTVVGMTTTGTATYGTQLGRYIKIGQMVHFTFVVSYSAHTGTGNMRINGLPFPALNLTNYNIPVSFRNDNIVSPANTLIQGYIQPNTVNVVLEAVAFATNNPVALALDAAGYFAVSGSYYANV